MDILRKGAGQWVLAGVAIAMVWGGFMAAANAEGGGVLYSYEQVRVAGQAERVLIPVAEGSLRGEVNQQLLEQAFERLRRAKRPTYGNSYAEVSGQVPGSGRVEVHIHADVAQFAPIIMAEAVYTLTEFGIDKVYFPGHTEEGLTRADIPFSAYTLTIPLWKVVPPGKVTAAQVRMPDNSLVPIATINGQWQSDRDALVDGVYSYLESEQDHTVRSVVRILEDLGDLRVASITPLLTHDAGRVREATLELLEGYENDEAVLAAVVGALQEERSDTLARKMADFLGKSNNPVMSVEKPFFLIERGTDEEAAEATKSLAEFSDEPRVVEQLSTSLRDERKDIATAAASALDELGVHPARTTALDDDKVDGEVREKLAEDLASSQNGEEIRLVGLKYLATNRSGGYANQAIAAIGELSIEEARREVESFLNADSRSQRLAAVSVVRERNDVASVEALVAAAERQEESREMRQAAYAIMVSQPLAIIRAQTEASSAAVQQVAFQAIGERAAKDGTGSDVMSTVEAGTGHRSAAIRGAAARALGEIGGDQALEILTTMTQDSSAVVRRDVALALGGFSDDANGETLEGYLDDSDPQVIAAAIDAMEQRGDQRASERIRQMVRHDDPNVRSSALRAVTSFIDQSDETTVRQHMGLLSGAVNDESQLVQLAALEQLGRFEMGMAVTNIALQVGAEDTAMRVAAIRALGDTGHQSARRLVESALGDRDPEVRREAIESLTRLDGAGARSDLEQRMEREDDPEVVEFLRTKLEQI